jgi:hypothetical protein
MTLSENLLENLSKAAGSGATTVTGSGGGWTATADVAAADTLSARLNGVELQGTAGGTVTQWADRIAGSVSGLRENLRVLEVDGEDNAALLRSTSPSRKGDVAGYYEVKLAGTEKATVKRYESDVKAGTPRTAVAFPLTHEVLGKLVDDITA